MEGEHGLVVGQLSGLIKFTDWGQFGYLKVGAIGSAYEVLLPPEGVAGKER